jgi:hypothetical protein
VACSQKWLKEKGLHRLVPNRHLSHANVLVLVFPLKGRGGFPLVYPLTFLPILYLPGLFL